MRDYKNLKVPRSFRSGATRVVVKRAQTGIRKRASAPGRVKKTAALLLLVAGLFCTWQGYRWVADSEIFTISGVDITGARELTAGELREIAGIFSGSNVFAVDLDAAAERVRTHPRVSEVRLFRRLPNRISMTIREREPAAVLETTDGRYAVDREGMVITRVGDTGIPALPRIVIGNQRVHPGERMESESLVEAFALLDAIAERGGWRPEDIMLKGDSPERLAVVYGGCEFRIGAGKYHEKLKRVGEIMADVQSRQLTIAYVDVRPERQAAVMVKEQADGFKHSGKIRGSDKR